MGSILEGTLNTRRILDARPAWLRSDMPVQLTAADVDALLELGVRTLVDLREPEHFAGRPCCLAGDSRFELVNMPITGGGAIPATPDDVSGSYVNMVDDMMRRIVEKIEASEAVMWFCAAGKDRTGVVAALLMRRAGCTREQIVANYLESRSNLADALRGVAERNPSARLDVMMPQARYMEEFLDWVDATGADRW